METEAKTAVESVRASPFGPVHVVEPTSQHTHTAILLHGRGSNGPEFAEELFVESKLSDGTNLAQRFPSWRWVFPSSQWQWSTAFQEELPAWFEAHSLTDIEERQNLQMRGLSDSVQHVAAIIDEELNRLGGVRERLILGGMSQGGAAGMWTLLCHSLSATGGRLGAFVGTSTWLPFAPSIGRLSGGVAAEGDGDAFVKSMMGQLAPSAPRHEQSLSTPVFLGHGVDDAFVDASFGRQARDVLRHVGLQVESKEYTGAELEGHWLKVPEEVDDIADFFKRASL